MSFLVEDGSNRLVVTEPGETIPKLGGGIEEDAESIKRRKKAPIAWNAKDTYDMALWRNEPKVGGVIEEDAESIKRRKKAPIAWNTKDTCTMALWSAYVDFLD
jgi:hypothetical protein